MHYPYGDQMVFSDCQPGLSITGKLFSEIGLLNGSDMPWLQHLAYLFSVILCGILMALILSRWIRNTWLQILFAVLITLMSPQLDRIIIGHNSLVYPCAIPLIWWSLIRLTESKDNLMTWIIHALVGIFLSLFHIYFLFIYLLTSSVVLLVGFLTKKCSARTFFSGLATSAIPFIFLFIWINITTKVIDRPDAPYGFFTYKATFQSVFLTPDGFMMSWLHERFHTPNPNMEGQSWVGVTGLLLLIPGLGWLYRPGLIRTGNDPGTTPNWLHTFYISAVLVLLFSMALPFSLGLTGLLEKIPFIGQFRSPGRFAWVFYFVYLGVISIWMSDRILNSGKVAIKILSLALIMIWITNVFQFQQDLGNEIRLGINENILMNDPDAVGVEKVLLDSGFSLDEFQSILYLPYFHLGSEKLYIDQGVGDAADAMSLAYHLHLPLMNSMMSRTSIGESLILCGLLGDSRLKKEIPVGMDDRFILLITIPDKLLGIGQDLINRAALIGRSGSYLLYKLDKNQLVDSRTISVPESAELPTEQNGSLFEQNRGFFDQDLAGRVMTPEQHHKFAENSGPRQVLMEIQVTDPGEYITEISFWTYTFRSSTAYPVLYMEAIDQNGNIKFSSAADPKYSFDNISGWVCGRSNLQLDSTVNLIRLEIGKHDHYLIDRILIRSTALDVWQNAIIDGETQLRFLNNYPISVR